MSKSKTQTVAVIGLGEVGGATFLAMAKAEVPGLRLVGVEIDTERRKQIRAELSASEIYTAKVQSVPPVADVYVIAVYRSAQVLQVLRRLNLSRRPLIVIESTLDPAHLTKLRRWERKHMDTVDLVVFPHRYVPGDAAHHVFNLRRVLGGCRLFRAVEFYRPFMNAENVGDLIHVGDLSTPVLAKVAENAWRFMSVVLAQELYRACVAKGYDFAAVREAMNSKWNIEVPEVREGVKGRCLPKDMRMFARYFKGSPIFAALEKCNKEFVKARRSKRL